MIAQPSPQLNERSAPPSAARLALGLAGLVLLPTLVLIDTAWSVERGWRLSDASLFRMIVYLAVLFPIVPVMLCCSAGWRRFICSHVARLWTASCSLLLAWLLADAALGVARRQGEFHLRSPNLQIETEPSPSKFPGISGVAVHSTNSLGIRGPELEDDSDVFAILAVGGETVEGIYLDDSETWTALLDQSLNRGAPGRYWVGGAGISEFATGHHLRFLRNSSLLDRIDCVILLAGINDLMRAAYGMGSGEIAGPFWYRSATIEAIKELWNSRLEQGYVFDRTGGRLQGTLRLGRPIPEPAGGWNLDEVVDAYETRLRAIIQVAHEREFRLVCVTQPFLWDKYLAPAIVRRFRLARLDPTPRPWELLTAENLREAMLAFNDRLDLVCRETGTEKIEAAIAMNGDEDYFFDDFRLNEAGHARMAGLISDWFQNEAATFGTTASAE